MTKKLLLSLALAVLSIACASAITPSDVQGKWVSEEFNVPLSDNTLSVRACYAFTFDKQGGVGFSLAMGMTSSEGGQKFSGNMFISGNGTYTCSGNSIHINIDPRSYKTEAPASSIKIQGNGIYTADDIQMMLESIASIFPETIGTSLDITDISLSGSKMKGAIYDEKYTFTKVKK